MPYQHAHQRITDATEPEPAVHIYQKNRIPSTAHYKCISMYRENFALASTPLPLPPSENLNFPTKSQWVVQCSICTQTLQMPYFYPFAYSEFVLEWMRRNQPTCVEMNVPEHVVDDMRFIFSRVYFYFRSEWNGDAPRYTHVHTPNAKNSFFCNTQITWDFPRYHIV